MYSVELMVAEHDNILKLLAAIRNACCRVLDGSELIEQDFRKMIVFARNYADKHHHGKEEQILFAEMTQHLGPIGTKLIQNGMLVEHDLGRLHMSNLEAALDRYQEGANTADKLDILTEAMGYANLLQRHIDKENQVIYTYAENNLSEAILKSVDERVRAFEKDAEDNKIQEQYLGLLQELTTKYA